VWIAKTQMYCLSVHIWGYQAWHNKCSKMQATRW